jgi:hypothetical protein
MLRVLSFAIVATLLARCGSIRNPEPRLLSQSARQDIEDAALVVLADVKSISDTASRHGPAGYRPVVVDLLVRHVLKGFYSRDSMCIIYMYPYGGYDGPGLAWIEAGTTGIFTLVPGDKCFRVVNDRRAIIRSYTVPLDVYAPILAFVASSTLPTKAGCRSGINQVAAEIWSISIPLVGSRATWRLMENDLRNSDVNIKSCTCAVIASVWKVNETCLQRLPPNAIDQSQLDATKATNRLLLQREQGWVRKDPIKWLQTISGGWGVDGSLVRLYELLSLKAIEIPGSSCTQLARGLREGGMERLVLERGPVSDEGVERPARRDLKKWLDGGCPATPDALRSLVGGKP